MSSSSTNIGREQHQRHVRRHARYRHRRRRRAEPCRRRRSAGCRARCGPTGITVQKQSNNFVLGAGVFSRTRPVRLAVPEQLHRRVHEGRAQARARASATSSSSASASTRCGCGSIPAELAARQITAGDVVDALREQNVQVAAGSIGEAPAREDQTYQISVRAAGRLQEAREFENIIVKAGADGFARQAQGRRRGGAGRRGLRRRRSGFRASMPSASAVIQLPTANALDVEAAVVAELERLSERFRRAWSTASPSTRRRSCVSRSARC